MPVLGVYVLSQEDPLVLNEYREDLRVECEKFGAVKKVILFDVSSPSLKEPSSKEISRIYLLLPACWDAVFVLQRHPDGVASVSFKEPEEADACIQSFNGRWFGGRQLSAQLWDGKTDYQVIYRKHLWCALWRSSWI